MASAIALENICNVVDDYVKDSLSDKFNSNEIESIQLKLLVWYHKNRRHLPWRGDTVEGIIPPPMSPYGTWVSESMCQQTRIETVVPYWHRWMATFPTVEHLADATPDEVNVLWAGLGYYRRAQQLLKGAQKVVKDFNSQIPDDVHELLQIPGIGPYTAGAISSIAFGCNSPLVDGNVIRVFSRLRAIKHEIASTNMQKVSWALATSLVERTTEPGNLNQALMELGATVCKPTSPKCGDCPVKDHCHAFSIVEQGQHYSASLSSSDGFDIEDLVPADVTYFPRKSAKKKPKDFSFSICVLRLKSSSVSSLLSPSSSFSNEDKFLFVRRVSTGLLANQWEFPALDIPTGDATEEAEGMDTDDGTGIQRPHLSQLWGGISGFISRTTGYRWQWAPPRGAVAIETADAPFIRAVPIEKRMNGLAHESQLKRNSSSSAVIMKAGPRKKQLEIPSGSGDGGSGRGSSSSVESEECGGGGGGDADKECMENAVRALPTVVHVFSHQRHTMFVSICDVEVGGQDSKAGVAETSHTSEARLSARIITATSESTNATVAGTESSISSRPSSTVRKSSGIASGGTDDTSSYREHLWMTASEIIAAGITSGCKKVLDLVIADSPPGGASKAGKNSKNGRSSENTVGQTASPASKRKRSVTAVADVPPSAKISAYFSSKSSAAAVATVEESKPHVEEDVPGAIATTRSKSAHATRSICNPGNLIP